MRAFSYTKPASLDEAAQKLAAAGEGKLLAGGMTLLPTMKQGLAAPDLLVDLSAVAGLKAIAAEGGGITIGAMARHADVAVSDLIWQTIPALADLAGGIGDQQVRHRGTIGGSLANNDPAADYPAAVLALDATIRTDRREVTADAFFRGMFETDLQPDEIITAVHFPKPELAGYAKFRSPASRYALVGVFVARTAGGVRVAVTGAGPGVFRSPVIEQALAGSFTAAALGGITLEAAGLNSDIHAEAAFRAHLITVMAKRAVEVALAAKA